MKKEPILFTSEAVGEGHPDKVCDQISDAILDATLKLDKEAHVACEVVAMKDAILITGEISAKAKPDFEKIARDVLANIGYTSEEVGIDAATCEVIIRDNKQSENINQSVRRDGEKLNQGAGDQGIIFGYATDETDEYMPLSLTIAQKLVERGDTLRKQNKFKWARPDSKSQVTIDYSDPNNIRIHTILMAVQHDPNYDEVKFKQFIKEEIMLPVIREYKLNEDFKAIINSSGTFVIGGPSGDTGLTGRKIIIDTYGGAARHGGGAFSGKDPSKVDRSAAYYARYMAKNLVAAGAASRLEIQLAYAIGKPEPLSISVATFKTSNYDDEVILSIIDKVFDCRPGAIIEHLSLTEPQFSYASLAKYGHFGRKELDIPWEKLDKVNEIKALLKNI